MSTMTMIVTLIIFLTFICRDFKTVGGGSEYAQLIAKKNASIRLKPDNPGFKYNDHYLCGAECTEERK